MKLQRTIRIALAGAVCAAALFIEPVLVFAAPADIGAGLARNAAAVLDQSESNRLALFHDYSISPIGTTAGEIPGSPGTGLVSPFLGSWAADGSDVTEKPWSISATPIVGYDSNPQALKGAQSSPFAGGDVNAIYRIALDRGTASPTIITAGYDATGAFDRGAVKQGDVLQQTVFGNVRHGFAGDTIILAAAVQDQFTIQHGTAFLNSIDIHPTVETFWLPGLSTEVGYQFSHMEFFFPLLIRQQDPDTERETFSFNLHLFPLPQTQGVEPSESPDKLTDIIRHVVHRMTIGYGHVWNPADGEDYKYEADRIVFGLDQLRPFATDDLTFDLQYARETQLYHNFNSEVATVVGGTPLLVRRHDHIDIFTIRANAHLFDLAKNRGTLGGFLQWDVISDRSTVAARDFNEYLVSAGITFRY